MSEPQPPIPAEDLERIEKEAEEFAGPATEEKYPVGYLNRYEGFVAGAKAEHCHLRERIEQLEETNEKLSEALELSGGFDVGFEYGAEASGRKELEEENKRLSKQLEEKDREIARLRQSVQNWKEAEKDARTPGMWDMGLAPTENDF